MPLFLSQLAGAAVLAAALTVTASGTAPAGALRHLGATLVPGYTGQLDRLDADIHGNRLFLAAQERGTLEVFELSSGKHLKSVRGFDTPHRALYLPDRKRIVVIDSGAGDSKMIDSTSYKILHTIKLQPGADMMSYDPVGRTMYVISSGKRGNTAQSYLTKLNPRTGEKLGELAFDTDRLEAIALERHGPKLYLNVTGRNFIAVINKSSFAVVDKWTVTGAQADAPMVLDEAGRRLYLVTRDPCKVLVFDTGIGYIVDAFDAPRGSNEIMVDAKSHRLYLAGDNGISVFQQRGPRDFAELERVRTTRAAQSAVLVPEMNRLFVAQSASEDGDGAALLRFDLLPEVNGLTAVAK